MRKVTAFYVAHYPFQPIVTNFEIKIQSMVKLAMYQKAVSLYCMCKACIERRNEM